MAAAGHVPLYCMTNPGRSRQNKSALTLDLSNLGGQQAKVVWGTTVNSQQVACTTIRCNEATLTIWHKPMTDGNCKLSSFVLRSLAILSEVQHLRGNRYVS